MSTCERCNAQTVEHVSNGPMGVRTTYSECPTCGWLDAVSVSS